MYKSLGKFNVKSLKFDCTYCYGDETITGLCWKIYMQFKLYNMEKFYSSSSCTCSVYMKTCIPKVVEHKIKLIE